MLGKIQFNIDNRYEEIKTFLDISVTQEEEILQKFKTFLSPESQPFFENLTRDHQNQIITFITTKLREMYFTLYFNDDERAAKLLEPLLNQMGLSTLDYYEYCLIKNLNHNDIETITLYIDEIRKKENANSLNTGKTEPDTLID